MILEIKNPITVIVKENNKEGIVLYVQSGGNFFNDIWTIALCEGGDIIHVRTDQIKVHANTTMDIKK